MPHLTIQEKDVPVNDSDIINQVLSGDKQSFAEIIRKYEQRLYGLVYKIIRNASDAEDIMQETFINAYQKLDTFKAESNLFTWLCAIAYNNSLQYLRRRKWSQWLSLDAQVFAIEAKPTQTGNKEESNLAIALQTALMKLPIKLRSALVMSEVEGINQEEIARIMNCPVGTVWSYISRAKERLRDLLGPQAGMEDNK